MTESQRLLKAMIVSTLNAREVEANRVSRALHDEVGQVLSAVGLQLEVLKLDYRENAPGLESRVHEIQQFLDTAVEQVRALSYDLNPAVVERAGLQLALERLVGRMRSGYKGNLRLVYSPVARVPTIVARSWYKIAELAIANAIQHSDASQIEVYIKTSGPTTTLQIRDNGKGFSLEDARLTPSGLGLLLMDHYALQAAIRFRIDTGAGEGTLVHSTFRTKEEKLAQAMQEIAKS